MYIQDFSIVQSCVNLFSCILGSRIQKKKNMELLGETLTSYCDFHKPAESHLREAMAKMPFGFHQ